MEIYTEDKNIIVKIIADSVSPSGSRMTTFELEYPRVIHSELKTHRALSGNSMSSRAVPISKMIEQVSSNPAMLSEYGKKKAGMQSAGEHNELIAAGYTSKEWWHLAALSAAKFAQAYEDAGYHKQVANRLLEPFQRMKTVISGTEWTNFFWLRVDEDADPTLRELAELMLQAYTQNTPELLKAGQWHTPYVWHSSKVDGSFSGYYILDEGDFIEELTEQEALAISSSCCAQVSYRVLNATKEKALNIYEKLLSGNKVHASPFEHQASPMREKLENAWKERDVNTEYKEDWETGVTHMDREGNLWSGNLKGFVQHRQLIPNNVKNK